MVRIRLGLILAAVFMLAATGIATARADDDSPADKILKAFAARLDSLPGTAEARQAAKDKLSAALADGQDPAFAMNEALMAWSDDYRTAVGLADAGATREAVAALQPFTQSAEPFVAADATYILARTWLDAENFEEAAPLLDSLTGAHAEYTLNAAIAKYYLGVTQARLLKNADAIESLSIFLQSYPEAPERLRVSAWQQIQDLSAIVEGQLSDVHQRMDFSRRKLDLEDSGDLTQEQQNKIVDLLARLIREQEKRECSSCNSKKNSNTPQQQAKQEAKRPDDPQQSQSQTGGVSNNPNGVAQRVFSDGPASPWSKLRDRSRDPAYSAIKDQLPAKYREIVERYTEKAQSNESDDSN